ncbi:hypothetical protein INR49_032412 [Caranx melampygus]|nr:hypothetical protein INR49_032412 [Caranx melampygus]
MLQKALEESKRQMENKGGCPQICLLVTIAGITLHTSQQLNQGAQTPGTPWKTALSPQEEILRGWSTNLQQPSPTMGAPCCWPLGWPAEQCLRPQCSEPCMGLPWKHNHLKSGSILITNIRGTSADELPGNLLPSWKPFRSRGKLGCPQPSYMRTPESFLGPTAASLVNLDSLIPANPPAKNKNPFLSGVTAPSVTNPFQTDQPKLTLNQMGSGSTSLAPQSTTLPYSASLPLPMSHQPASLPSSLTHPTQPGLDLPGTLPEPLLPFSSASTQGSQTAQSSQNPSYEDQLNWRGIS